MIFIFVVCIHYLRISSPRCLSSSPHLPKLMLWQVRGWNADYSPRELRGMTRKVRLTVFGVKIGQEEWEIATILESLSGSSLIFLIFIQSG